MLKISFRFDIEMKTNHYFMFRFNIETLHFSQALPCAKGKQNSNVQDN
jgi:hypothetical protein